MHRRAPLAKTLAILTLPALFTGGCSGRPAGDPGVPYGDQHREAVLGLRHQDGPFRLSGGWEPRDVAPAGAGARDSALRFLAELTGPALRDPAGSAAAGNLLAALGMPEQALSHLETARRAAPRDARILNDLGVVLQALAVDRAENHVRALELFDQAVEIDPGLIPARFNLALALEDLSLRWQAARAWKEVLDLETSDPWAARARRHLEDLRGESGLAPSLAPSCAETAERADAAGSEAAAHPFRTRRHLEGELLRRWAEAARSGRMAEAERCLGLFHTLAGALAERTGDRLLLDVAEAFRRDAGHHRLERVADAALLYLEGMRLRAENRCDLAEPRLLRAARELARAGNPLGLLAQLYGGICASRRSSAGEVPELSKLLRRLPPGDYPLLRARILWMLALRAGSRAEPVSALALRRQALSVFESAGETEMVSVLQSMMADNLLELGRVEESWRLRIGALRAAAGDTETRARLVPAAAEVCQRMGLARAALRFRNEEIESARRADDPLALAAGLSGRGVLRSTLGEPGPGRDDLRRALDVAESIPDETTRQHVGSRASLALAIALREDDPRAALRAVDDALRRRRRAGLRLLLPETHLERARILRRLGSPEDAVASLEEALELLEETRATLDDPRLRVSYYERSRQIFDELVASSLALDAPPERLLGIVARARARDLAETLPGAMSAGLPERATEHLRSLPASSLFLVYYELPDALLCLRHHRGVLTAHRLPPLTEEDRTALLAWRRELTRAERLPSPRDGERAYGPFERLLGPVWPHAWGGGGELVVVPDGLLARLPFAAIVDPATRRPLVLDHPVRLLPGPAVSGGPRDWETATAGRVLAVGDPAFDPALGPGLGRLPAAAIEARSVAASAPGGETLVAQDATESALAARLPGFDVLHLATHAVNTGDPRFSHLLLTPSGSDDGVLYAHELGRLDLRRTRLVVLSACSTAAGPVDALEGPLTLARSFLAQGVPEVVAASWPVADEPARAFMEQFYTRLRSGHDASRALASTQAWALTHGDAETAAPATWAAFQVIGGASRPIRKGDLP